MSAAGVELYDIGYPLRDALDGRVEDMTIGRAHLRLTVAAAELGSALGVDDLALSTADNGSIQLHASVNVFGKTTAVTAEVAVTMTGRTLHIRATPVAAAGVAVPSALLDTLRQRLSISVPVPALPFEVTMARASVSGGDLVITARTSDVNVDHLKPMA